MTWPVAPLASVADVKLGRQRSPQNHTGPNMRKYLRAANIGWSGLLLEDVKSMNFTDSEMVTFRLEPGDILLNEASGSPAEVGKPAIWNGEIADCAFQNTLLRVRSGPKVAPEYLIHYFRYQARSAAFAQGSRGVGIRHLGREALAGWPVPLPPIDQQLRVAQILEQAEWLRAKRRLVCSQLEVSAHDLFEEMFGRELGGSKVTLGEVAEVTSGITKGRRTAESTRPVPYLAVANVQAGRLDLRQIKEIAATESEITRYALAFGDLVLTEGGDPDKLGRGTVWRSELASCIHQNHIFRVRVVSSSLEPEYLSAFLASKSARDYFLRSAKQTTGIASINTTQLRAAPVYVPSPYAQRCYLDRLAGLNEVKQCASRQEKALDMLTFSLQSRAFAGQL